MSTQGYVDVAGLQVDGQLYEFVEREVLPGLDITGDAVWSGMARLVAESAPSIAQALAVRSEFQRQLDGWHRERSGRTHDAEACRPFLESFGYLAPVGPDFTLETDRIDPEIAELAGPQLVVPISNARYALN